MHGRFVRWAFIAAIVLLMAGGVGLYSQTGWYGFNMILRRGGSIWVPVASGDSRISNSMRLALGGSVPAVHSGAPDWVMREDGFETAELAVLAGDNEVDRLLLVRIAPEKFRFSVFNAPSGRRGLDEWMTSLGAKFVVNGSYFAIDGSPDTPFMSEGVTSGPKNYDATHGAFIVSDGFVGVRDLQGVPWRDALAGARHAMVSYPLLTGPGPSRVKSDWRWLANRSFVGQDSAGRIIIGTTKDAFLSLERLAAFLRQSPLGLTLTLNVDGGPVACQGVEVAAFSRNFCGDWEMKFEDNEIKLLRPLIGSRRWGLPIVLAVLPR
jgi:hypothetical protein